MIFEFQISASSLRQLSIFSEPASAAASPANNAAAATPAPTAPLNVCFILSSLARAFALGGFALTPRGARKAQRVINPSFARCERCHGFAQADTAAGDQDRRLDLATGLAKRGFRLGLADAGDHGDDSERAVAQFRIVGLQIDHQSLMDVAEFEPHQ